MDQITRILEKLNQQRSGKTVTLADFMPMSLAEVRSLAGSRLSREEAQLLHRAAIKEQQNNILYTARALTRANPLLKKEMGAARTYGATPYGYNDIIMPRADEFAAPGAVSSMFSPAGYLTELYREARGLHQKNSVNNLDKRRPDLAKLVLSQENLDKEISTLSLANEQLETALMAKAGQTDKNKYYETLATSRRSGVTPYNAPFEGIRNALAQQDFVLPDHVLSKGAQSAAQMALYAGISPELYAILTEKTDGLSEAATEALQKKNFPGIDTDRLMNLDALANYYGLPRDEIQEMLEKYGAKTPDDSHINTLPLHFVETDGKITVIGITKKIYNHPKEFFYIDLVPQGDKQFLVNFSVKNSYPQWPNFRISPTSYWKDEIYIKENFIPEAGQHYSIPVILEDSSPTDKIHISITRFLIKNKDDWANSSCDFFPVNTALASSTWLLILNKTLRLAKATGMTPLKTQRALTRLKLKDTDSDATVLHRFCEFLLYRKRYNISTDDALILSGATIRTASYDGQLSQFDRIFNNPPLNGEVYSLDYSDISLKPDTTDTRRDILKRAFSVNNIDLLLLSAMTNRHGNSTVITNNASKISTLYLIRLLADSLALSISQLNTLLLLSPFTKTDLDQDNRLQMMDYLWQTTQWLNEQNLSADQLLLLLTTDAPAVPTKEMDIMLDALRNGGIDNTNTDTLYSTMAPVIAASMQLQSAGQGEYLLRWLDTDQNSPIISASELWSKIQLENLTPPQKKSVAAYCQALAQRVLVIRTFALSDTELQVLSTSAPVKTISGLQAISHFHNLVNRCGGQAGTILDALQSSTLTVKILAQALNVPGITISQILGLQADIPDSPVTKWTQLGKLPVYLDISDNLHITPKEITHLLAVSENASPSYADLTTLAGLLQAGLNEQQTKQLQNQSEPRRSEALSGEYRALVMGKPLANRDDIWRKLLIDGKVSAEITTTPLADAIAGIQLYINRTVAGDEPGADNAVLERQFFKDWDTYNKRYSTWAGVSQLVYYPENFIDPTIRIGQTGMMNTMLEQLSQSELNSDTLENGFRQYLTAFEQVANLKVISGYHDAVEIDEGNTWFIGTSQTEPKKYYWRKADHSKCQNGRFAANAWSDWKEITCAVNPYQDMVRPVIYRSRLYLLWIEEQKRKDDEGKKNISSFTLKLTHIKYDGSWASPFSYDVTDEFKPDWKEPGLYCTNNREDNTLTIACYEKQPENESMQSVKVPVNSFGLRLKQNMVLASPPDTRSILTTVVSQLDTKSVTRVNMLLTGRYSSNFAHVSSDNAYGLRPKISSGEFILSKKDEKFNLVINPEVHMHVDTTELFGFTGTWYREQCIREVNSGDDIYIPGNIQYTPQDEHMPDGKCTLIFFVSTFGYLYPYVTIPAEEESSEYPFVFMLCADDNGNDNIYWDMDIEHDYAADDEDSDYVYRGFGGPHWVEADAYFENYKKYTLFNYNAVPVAKINIDKYIKKITPASADSITLTFFSDNNIIKTISGSDIGITVPEFPESDNGTMSFRFGELIVDVTDYLKNKSSLDLTVTANFKLTTGQSASCKYSLQLKTPEVSTRVIVLHTTENGAQYMEWDAYRTRLNTLFARQLIEKANRGIDAVLSPETQNLREPKPGPGTYVTLTLKPYDPAIHGSDRKFTIYAYHVLQTSDQFPVYTGTLNIGNTTTITLFYPRIHNAAGNKDNFYLRPEYQSGKYKYGINLVRTNDNDPNGWYLNKDYHGGTFPGLESVSGLSQPDEPMDFSGANALYFWELFYYTPMMVAMRLLQEQNFTEANRWLSYIWRPAASGAGDWRVRPLKEDTSWNADPLDSVDPDAVAQNDPMHYKVSTLMKLLDLLIARGDSAYRMLERDTLNEAKMWYMQALGLLGDKPLTTISGAWSNPALSNAADKTQAKQFHDEISRIRNGGLLPDVRTANTLTGLFLPQQNEKLLGYWQTLEMRLFNLRNNLSIDGQPLSLPVFAAPADPAALLSAAAAASGGSKALPSAAIPAMRFPQALDSARSLTGQLMQFGSSLQGLIERRDAEAMSELLQNQAGELMLSSLRMQEQALTELDAEKKTLEQSRAGAQSRFDSYRALYDENVSAEEKRTMDLYLSSAILSTSIGVLDMAAAAADMAPNVFGMAVGGSRWGGIPKAIGSGIALAASATKITADNISQSEAWRRRRQEWEIQKNNAESEVKQIDAQLEALAVRRTATEMQREHLEIQQAQTQAQLEFLQRKFSNKALYSWLHGRLASIYYRFYDLTATRCMMAEAAFAWQTGETTRYIKPGAWQSSNAGLMAGESLLLNLTEMEQAWLKWNHRTLKVTRTVSLAKVYKEYDTPVNLAEKIAELLKGSGSGNTPAATGLSMTADKELYAAFNLKALKIAENYPARLGKTRRIKQISVTLPALTGPYQDVRAVLSYGGDVRLPDGCKAIAVSHGMNDDGQFRLDFNDGHWLPFEGIPVDNDSSLFLSFPEATKDEQKALLLSLSDIIIHIRYTIR
ncbi:TPA: insecticidal toxin protein [Morganella morganii]|uniref:Tc toxin subunit A-related protein n=3 Tax=Morganella morganii TaxID=582 RepID=UPI000916A35C|nr:neuraminidase-like domain-containing protein [Morganella morganii]SGE08472.1 Salmonella virulence plasmid 28.1kDa A protein [Mycobacterium tuberculosis]ELA7728661.1 insecticidal toxin protein [Morganella morganii]MBC3999207.1 insecticidal toxin protein [Morganella morganii]MBT0312654.1 insecticidal toxin protein [Morganella morganii subsp. morganii]MBT0414138.1 insecticidal toxin protein [Morganella morganii subsp. morganii]